MKIVQFGFKVNDSPKGVPILDCRVLRNPWGFATTEAGRVELVRNDPRFEIVVSRGVRMLRDFPIIAVGCTHGRHRSKVIAAEIAARTGATVESIVP